MTEKVMSFEEALTALVDYLDLAFDPGVAPLRAAHHLALDTAISDQRKIDAEKARDHVCQPECHYEDEARDGCGEVIAENIEDGEGR